MRNIRKFSIVALLPLFIWSGLLFGAPETQLKLGPLFELGSESDQVRILGLDYNGDVVVDRSYSGTIPTLFYVSRSSGDELLKISYKRGGVWRNRRTANIVYTGLNGPVEAVSLALPRPFADVVEIPLSTDAELKIAQIVIIDLSSSDED